MSTAGPNHRKAEYCVNVLHPNFWFVTFGMHGCIAYEVLKVVTAVSNDLQGRANELLATAKRK